MKARWSFALLVAVVLALGLVAGCGDDDEPNKTKRAGTGESGLRKAEAYNEWSSDAKEAKRRQTETAKALGVPVEKTIDLGKGVKLKLVLIPAGELVMNSTLLPSDEKLIHRAQISKPFYMGTTEVTHEQWQAVMGNNPSRFKGAKNPVERVSWKDCQAFVKKLNVKYNGLAFALPTDAEWEYACRAGSTTKYCFGDSKKELGDHAWYGANSDNKTHPVGLKKPNVFGLYDMHGNVSEWCQDWSGKDHYENSREVDPLGATRGAFRVLRGGSWSVNPAECRSASRLWSAPTYRHIVFGCRVVVRDVR